MKEKILTRLQDMLKGLEIASILRKAGENNLPVDILTVLLEDFSSDTIEAMGELFFSPDPVSEQKDLETFNAVITLSESLNPEFLPALYESISILNFYTEGGVFAISKEKNVLIYRHMLTIPLDKKEDEVYSFAEMFTARAIGVANRYAGVLLMVADGRMTVEDVEDIIIPQ